MGVFEGGIPGGWGRVGGGEGGWRMGAGDLSSEE